MLSLPCSGHSLFLVVFCTAIWCQAAHRIRSHSSGHPTHSKDDLQLRQRRRRRKRFPKPSGSLPLSLSPIGKSISLLAVQLFERLRPILADKTAAASLRKKRKVSLSLGLEMMRWKSFHAEPNKRSGSWNCPAYYSSSWLRLRLLLLWLIYLNQILFKRKNSIQSLAT